MNRMYCHCGHSVWMHFRLEYGSYRPYFTSRKNSAEPIGDCQGCGISLSLMVTHLASADAQNAQTAAPGYLMPMLPGQSERHFLLPAT